jgi:hypothetical protein
LKQHTKAYWDKKPFRVTIEVNEADGIANYVLQIAEDVPTNIAAIAGENIHANRSALDLLVNQLVKANGGEFTSDTGFPMYKFKKDLVKNVDRRLAGADESAKKQILGLRPYRRGDKWLWILHNLDILDKHEELVTVGSAYQSVNLSTIMKNPFGDGDIEFPKIAIRPADRMFPLVDGDVIFSDHTINNENTGMESNFGFSFELAFDGGKVASGLEIISTLEDITNYVDTTIQSFAKYFMDG